MNIELVLKYNELSSLCYSLSKQIKVVLFGVCYTNIKRAIISSLEIYRLSHHDQCADVLVEIFVFLSIPILSFNLSDKILSKHYLRNITVWGTHLGRGSKI